MFPRKAAVPAASLALALLSSVALAQGPPGGPAGPGGPGGPPGPPLVMAVAVQKELALSESQKSKLKKLDAGMVQKRRQSFSRRGQGEFDPEKMQSAMDKLRREQEEGIAKILDKKQKERLAEIELQREGIFAVARPDVAKKLKLTSDQTAKVKSIVEEMRKAEREAMPPPPEGFPRARTADLRARFWRTSGRRRFPWRRTSAVTGGVSPVVDLRVRADSPADNKRKVAPQVSTTKSSVLGSTRCASKWTRSERRRQRSSRRS